MNCNRETVCDGATPVQRVQLVMITYRLHLVILTVGPQLLVGLTVSVLQIQRKAAKSDSSAPKTAESSNKVRETSLALTSIVN